MSKSKQLNPNWFWRMLGFKGGSIKVTEKGVTLHKSDRSYFIDNHSFVKKSRVEENLIFYSLVFDTSEGEVRFGKLPQAKANEVFEWLQAHWYLEIFPEIDKVFKKISRKLNQSYVRSSEWLEIEKEAKSTLNRFIQPPQQGLIEKSKRNPFVGIHRYATMGLGGLEDYRKAYVNKKKNKFVEYFANIESNPLTDDQINACIIDEDNNLVLAGAGTGKTSTMIGRAGFLLEDAQAKPQDILMIAFAKKAAEEMQDRMKERINRDDVSISTFHKLGKDIIAKVENGSPSISKYAEDKQGVLKHDINIWITELLKKKDYKDKVLEYFEDYLFIEEDPFSFDSEGEYLEYLETNEIRTFKGEKVKGHGERIIANHLFRMGVEYQYEEPYKHTTRTLDYTQYKPDFYLPEYGIYIEHFGTARDGSTAPYIDMDLYQQGMDWKRSLHENNNTQLVETFFYEHIEGNLKKVLNERLEKAGIKFKPLPDEAVLETLRESGDITAFASLVTDIIKLLKVNWFDQSKLDKKIKNSPHPKHLEVMLELVNPIMGKYQQVLDANEEIDFEDMIGKALDYVETGKFKSTWKYIMVDEFQDISDSRARLVQALQRSSKKCSIFCVGDDWQAIYRFTGSILASLQALILFSAQQNLPH
jgi:DNA helicase-4